MKHSAAFVVALFSFTSLTACGGSSDSDLGGVGGSSGAGGSSGSGGATGGSAGTGGGSGSGGTTQCSDFVDQTSPDTVNVIIRNERTAPIFLGDPNAGCGPVALFHLTDPGGKSVPQTAGGCGNTCEALQQHGDYCTGACMAPALIRINPGGMLIKTWQGTTFQSADMPLSCYKESEFAASGCSQRVIANAGDYEVKVAAWTDANCGGSACDCTATNDGSCTVDGGGQPTGNELSSTSSVAYPKESDVTLTFK